MSLFHYTVLLLTLAEIKIWLLVNKLLLATVFQFTVSELVSV